MLILIFEINIENQIIFIENVQSFQLSDLQNSQMTPPSFYKISWEGGVICSVTLWCVK